MYATVTSLTVGATIRSLRMVFYFHKTVILIKATPQMHVPTMSAANISVFLF